MVCKTLVHVKLSISLTVQSFVNAAGTDTVCLKSAVWLWAGSQSSVPSAVLLWTLCHVYFHYSRRQLRDAPLPVIQTSETSTTTRVFCQTAMKQMNRIWSEGSEMYPTNILWSQYLFFFVICVCVCFAFQETQPFAEFLFFSTICKISLLLDFYFKFQRYLAKVKITAI